MTDTIDRLRAARLRDENDRLRRALLEAVMTMNRSDPFFHVYMERYGDLVPIRTDDEGSNAA